MLGGDRCQASSTFYSKVSGCSSQFWWQMSSYSKTVSLGNFSQNTFLLVVTSVHIVPSAQCRVCSVPRLADYWGGRRRSRRSPLSLTGPAPWRGLDCPDTEVLRYYQLITDTGWHTGKPYSLPLSCSGFRRLEWRHARPQHQDLPLTNWPAAQ